MAADVDAWMQAYFHTWHAHDPSLHTAAAPHSAPTQALVRALHQGGPPLVVAFGPAADAARLMAPWYAQLSGHELRVFTLAQLQSVGPAPFRSAGLMLVLDPHRNHPEAAGARALAQTMACPVGTVYAQDGSSLPTQNILDQPLCHLVGPDGVLEGARWLAWLLQLAQAHAEGASRWGRALPKLTPMHEPLGATEGATALAPLAASESVMVWHEPSTAFWAEPIARRLQRAGFAVCQRACEPRTQAEFSAHVGHLVLTGPSAEARALIAQLEHRDQARVLLAPGWGPEHAAPAHTVPWRLAHGPQGGVAAWAAVEALCRLKERPSVAD